MNLRTALHIALSCSLLSSLAHAAGEAKSGLAPANLSVEKIIERNINARGGLAAWQRIHSISMSGQLDAGRTRLDGGQVGQQAHPSSRGEKVALRKMALEKGASGTIIRLPFRMDLQRPGKSRVEVQFNGDTAVQVFDGKNGWKLRPFIGRREVEKFSDEESRLASQQQELDGPLVDYASKGTRVAVMGSEPINGRDAYKLKLSLRNGDVRYLWIDAKSFLDVRYDGPPRHFDGKLRTVSTYYRDYQLLEGVMLPYRLETVVEGVRNIEQIVIDKISLNASLPEARFSNPE
jgi:hypothetical protein